jgi:VWFA-related protein
VRCQGTLCLLAVFFAAIPASAQDQPASAPPRVTEAVTVELTTVDFVASGAADALAGLSAEDIEILEDGVRREITHFSRIETTEGNEPVAAARRKFVLYFDNFSMLPSNRRPALRAASEFLSTAMRPGDEVMIASWDRSFVVEQTFTGSVKEAQGVLETLSARGASGTYMDAHRRLAFRQIDNLIADQAFAQSAGSNVNIATWSSALGVARRYAEAVSHDMKRSATALGELMSGLAEEDGRKIFVLVSESLPTEPGSELFQYIDNRRRNLRGSSGLSIAGEVSHYSTAQLIAEVGRIANSSRVTIYALNPGRFSSTRSGSVESSRPGEHNIDFLVESAGVEALQMLAERTGGLALIGSAPSVAFQSIARDVSSWYSVAFRSDSTRERRSLEVRARIPDVRVRAPKSVATRTPPRSQHVTQEVRANLLREPETNDLHIAVQATSDEAQGSTRRVPLQILIPVANLTLIPEGDELTGGFSIYLSSASADGKGPGTVHRQSHAIRWPRQAVEKLAGRQLTYALELVLERDRELISVGVVDELSNLTGFAKLKLDQR